MRVKPGADCAEVAPWEEPGAIRRDCEPHRAELLMKLSTASVVFAGLAPATLGLAGLLAVSLGLAVWVLSHVDLQKMEKGDTDPSGEYLTCRARDEARLGFLLALSICVLMAGVAIICGMWR